MAQEAREAAFAEEGYGSNLEALKSHIDKKTMLLKEKPHMLRQIENDAVELLKKNNIVIDKPIFSHTAHD